MDKADAFGALGHISSAPLTSIAAVVKFHVSSDPVDSSLPQATEIPSLFCCKAFSKTERTCLAEGKHSLKMQVLIPQGIWIGVNRQMPQLYVLQSGLWEAFHSVVRGGIELLSPTGQLQPHTCELAFLLFLAVSYSWFLVSPPKQTTWTQVLGFFCKGTQTETHFH